MFNYFFSVNSAGEDWRDVGKGGLKYYDGSWMYMTCLLIDSQSQATIIRACLHVCEVTNHVHAFLCYQPAGPLGRATIYRQESRSMRRQCWEENVKQISIRKWDVALNDDQVEQGDSHILECPSTLDVSWISVASSDLFNVMFERNVNIKLHIVFILPRKKP